MQIRMNNLRVSLLKGTPLKEIVARKLGIRKENIKAVHILRRAIDARRKNNICLVYHLVLEVDGENKFVKKLLADQVVSLWTEEVPPKIVSGKESLDGRPVVIGAGPAGLIAAWKLAQRGYKPLLLERGKKLAQRVEDVQAFWQTGVFNPDSNVQFGEGGAGTFSDGKLTTRVNDPCLGAILQLFVEAGAPEEILMEQKPHIGTDKLRVMVTGLTQKIVALGGEIRYEQQVVDLVTAENQVVGVVVAGGEIIKSKAVVLACGHSARDTYEMLAAQQVALEAKPFAIGLRIEHAQTLIDQAQYGEFAGHPKLGAADYALVHHDNATGRTAYSFCMCPGGLVVAAASEAGGVVTNGMSGHLRNSGVANSALVVNVTPADFEPGPLGGISFQRHYEQLAFAAGGSSYKAPAQSVVSFVQGSTPTLDGVPAPTYTPGLVPYALAELLPPYVAATLRSGLQEFGKKIKGFAETGCLTGLETRTSAPVRILRREEDKQSLSHAGLYPTGEGA
ncbi:MAG: NAD(P)/FAD-dependent oxidoreductase, partial [Acidaminococcaceae bacterium]